jgi:putative chitobiose transport system permease protein
MTSMRRSEWFLRYLGLALAMVIAIGPFLWLLSTALRSPGESVFSFPLRLLPEQPTFANFLTVWNSQPFGRYFANSALVAAISVTLNVTFASLAAYPLARMEFRGRNIILWILIGSMMVPFQLLLIPVFELATMLGLQNSYLGLILPHATTAFGVFFMRQAFLGIPAALEEVALIEGVNRFRIWWHVMLPLVKPSMATLAIFSFIASWGDFLWPLVLIDQPGMFTLPLGVNRLAGTFSLDWRLVAAGTVMSIVPILVFFAATQRFFIAGAMKGAVKG